MSEAWAPRRSILAAQARAGSAELPSLATILREASALHHDDIFIIEASSGESITYGRIFHDAAALAQTLQARGVTRGDRVVVMADNCLEYVFAAFGLMLCGAVMVPVSERFGDAGLRSIMQRAAPVMLLRGPGVARQGWARVPQPVIRELMDAATGPARWNPVETRADEPIVILFTSGTTGDAKGVVLSAGSQLADHLTYGHEMGLGRESRFIQVMPVDHADGWGYTLLVPFLNGASVLLTKPFDFRVCAQFEEVARAHGGNVVVAMPSILAAILARSRRYEDPASIGLKYVLTSSEKLYDDVRDRFEATFAVPVLEFYGITEAGVIAYDVPGMPRRPGTVGKLHPGVEIRRGDDGELLVRSPYLFSGYIGQGSRTERAFHQGYYRTGDRVEVDADGYLHLHGRVDNDIKVMGQRIVPGEIDDILCRHPAVSDACTIGVQDESGVSTVCAFVVIKGPETLDVQGELSAHCHQYLEVSMPIRFEAIGELPLTAIGKVDRAALVGTATSMWSVNE